VVPVLTDVMVTDVSPGGTVDGNVGKSETNVAEPMPALSQVVTGAICAESGGANSAARTTPAMLAALAAFIMSPPNLAGFCH
jgi:hypothetical protein